MRCTIVSKGTNEYITYLDDETNIVTVFQNKQRIANFELDCYSAVYDGKKFLYTQKYSGSIYITRLGEENVTEIKTPYNNVIIWHIVRGTDSLVLMLANNRDYVIYDYVRNCLAFDVDGLNLERFFGISLNDNGEGLAAGFNKSYHDDEEWRYHAESFNANTDKKKLESIMVTKYSLYEDFDEHMICYDSSKGGASLPVFYYFNDAYYSKNVSENYIVYVPGYEHHLVIVADIYGKIHRFLSYPYEISNSSYFAYNEITDIVTIATVKGEIHRYYVNNVDIALFDELYCSYNQTNYFNSAYRDKIIYLITEVIEQSAAKEIDC